MARILVVVLAVLLAACGSASTAAPTAGQGSAPASATPVASLPRTPAPSSSVAPNPPLALLPVLPGASLDDAVAGRLQAALQAVVDGGAPDAIAAVITADGTWAGAAGVDGPKGRAALPEDEYAIASVSKTILASLALKLAESDRLDLDAPVAEYLDGMDIDANGATVREALAMRSGIGDTVEGAIDAALADCGHALTQEEVLATIPAPFTGAGSVYHYSNPTYKLVGFAATSAAGEPLAQALRTHVLDPVGADRILLQGPDAATPERWALPIAGHEGSLDLDRYGTGGTLPCLGFSSLSQGASGMAADAPSLARWGWGLFAGEILSADSLAAMTTTDEEGHGLGIDKVFDFSPDLAYAHAGSLPGYAALLAILPERKVVVVMFVNDEQADPWAAAGKLIAALKG